MTRFDVAFIGSSPNALAGAARLARGGARVVVLDTREFVGGPVATEEFAPGFRGDLGVSAIALCPEVEKELGVSVEVIRRDSVSLLGEAPLTLSEMPALPSALYRAVDCLRAIYRSGPPEVPVGTAEDAAALAAFGASLKALGPRAMHDVLRLTFLSARDFVVDHVEDERVRALLAGAAVRALSEGPFAPGTLFGLLHHLATDDGLFRASAKGGVRSVAVALARVGVEAGAEIRTGVPGPLRVAIEDGIAKGVLLGDGTTIEADWVVSDYDARTTFTKLVSPAELEPETNRAIRALRYRGTVARVHFALSRLPIFRGVSEHALRGTLVVAPDVASLERAWDDAKRGHSSAKPYLELTIPSLADPSFAPEGHHVLDVWVAHEPHGRGDREGVVERVLSQLAPFAVDLRASILHHHVSLPEDLEGRFGLSEGQMYGGEVRLDQAYFLRPLPGCSHHRTPIEGLFLGGSAAHPGGYTGRSGFTLAGHLLALRAS